jgi:L-fuculose-phosphate aldolase
MDKIITNLKRKVAETAKDIFDAGLVTSTWGNVSARAPELKKIAITPSGLCKGLLKPNDMVIIDTTGKPLEGKKKPSSETPMHLIIYDKRSEVNAIIHTHSPFATSFAVAGLEIPVVNEELAAVVGGSVHVARYALSGTEKLGNFAYEALGDRNAVLLKNHGVVAAGPTLEDAFRTAIAVENTAKIAIFAKLLGEPIKLKDEDVKEAMENFRANYPKP